MNPIPLTAPNGRIYAYACGRCHHIPGHGERLVVVPGFPDFNEVNRRYQAARLCCTCRACGAALGSEPDDPHPDRRGRGACSTCERWYGLCDGWRRVAMCVDIDAKTMDDYYAWQRVLWRLSEDEDS